MPLAPPLPHSSHPAPNPARLLLDRFLETKDRGDLALSISKQQLLDIGVWGREHDLKQLQTAFCALGMCAMGNRGKNFRDATLAFCFLHTYDALKDGRGQIGLVFKNYNGHKGMEGDTLYSACLPHVCAHTPLSCHLLPSSSALPSPLSPPLTASLLGSATPSSA